VVAGAFPFGEQRRSVGHDLGGALRARRPTVRRRHAHRARGVHQHGDMVGQQADLTQLHAGLQRDHQTSPHGQQAQQQKREGATPARLPPERNRRNSDGQPGCQANQHQRRSAKLRAHRHTPIRQQRMGRHGSAFRPPRVTDRTPGHRPVLACASEEDEDPWEGAAPFCHLAAHVQVLSCLEGARLFRYVTPCPFRAAASDLFHRDQAQARAQENASPLPACPAGNLLAGKMPSAWQEIERNLSLLTDETVAPEGAVWDASLAAILQTGASTITWDLGQVISVRHLAIQADANDTYNFWSSLDGKEYKLMGQIDPATGHGLRMRTWMWAAWLRAFCAWAKARATVSTRSPRSRPIASCPRLFRRR